MQKTILLLLFSLYFLPSRAIQQIRWGSSADPLHGLCITWQNAGISDSIQWGYTPLMEAGRFKGIQRSGYTDNFFSYTFPTVTPNASIYYILYDSGSNSWSPQLIFKTAPPFSTSAFSFLAMADSRNGMAVWTQITNLANAKNTDFTIFTGDITGDATDNLQWDDWFNSSAIFLQNNIVYFCEGNHEANDTAKFQNNFTMPMANGSKLHYSFSYGNAIFICLNTEQIDAEEYNWLISELQANSSKTWKIIYFHRPFFTIGNHAGEMDTYLNSWWAAFDTYGVDLLINGHDHMYERSKPINYSLSPASPVASYGSGPGQGRCEIVCGGSGAPLYTGSASWFIQTYQSNYNFCKFNVNDSTMIDSTFDNSGNLIETFMLDKTALGVANKTQLFNPVSIFPNPATNSFTLKYSANECGNAIISITGMNGKVIYTSKVQKTHQDFEYKIDAGKFPKGVYSVEINIDHQKDNALLVVK
ncbi:MAG: metallophosphoesterase [Bacteroidetes bacterium]|nr:metallophosphoesterase [Bacteroidota bacterium]